MSDSEGDDGMYGTDRFRQPLILAPINETGQTIQPSETGETSKDLQTLQKFRDLIHNDRMRLHHARQNGDVIREMQYEQNIAITQELISDLLRRNPEANLN